MNTTFIVNPVAGRGKARRAWRFVEAWAKGQSFEWEVLFTRGPGEAGQLAAAAQRAGSRRLVVVGGDGTLQEVVNGMDRQEGIVGLIPAGTGNDFARTAGIPRQPLAAAQLLVDGAERVMDLGRVGDRLFLNVAGVGIDAQVAMEINLNFTHLTGPAAYLAALVKVLSYYRNAPVLLEVDGEVVEERVMLVAVGNGQYYGGGMRIVPPARVDDGWFHLCIVGDASPLETISTLPRLFNGSHLSHPKVRCLKGQRVSISSPVDLAIHADGEVVGSLPVEFSLQPAGVRVWGPPAEQ